MPNTKRRKSFAWGGALLLVVALASTATGANAEPGDSDSTLSEEGAPEIRLDVPTSIAFDPLAEISGGDASGVEATPAAGPWTDVHDYPTPVFDDRIGLSYAMGGSDGTQVSNVMLAYREDLDDWWDEDMSLPRPRQAPAVSSNRWGEMVMAGGWDESGEPTSTTHYYDGASDGWVYWFDEMPGARAAAGYASFTNDEALYVIGGCTTAECTPVSDSVFALDGWWDEWAEVADYPVPVAYPSCGAWKERIYCTGGSNGTEGISDSYVYDRRTNTWSPLPEPPTDSWGTQHAMVDGILIINGGVQGGAVTNNTFGYDVRAGAWIDLPNSNTAKYRGAGGCVDLDSGGRHFMSVGGLDGTTTPVAQAEILSGFTACGDGLGVIVKRYAGHDRYGTAAAVAASYPTEQDTVFVTTGQNYPDALAASARAGSLQAPILLTRPDRLPGETRHELERLAPQSVVVVGGTAAVSNDAMQLIGDASEADSVRRISGSDRYETAAAVAAEVETANTVFIATGANFPDALAGGARAAALDAPLLLVKPDRLPASTLAQLERLSPETIVVLGGKASISDSVVTRLGDYGTVRRIAGANRWETAALIAAEYSDGRWTGVASGRTWPDAVAGSARIGSIDGPLILVDTDRIPAPSWAELQRLSPSLVDVYGGTKAVSEGVFEELKGIHE